MIKSWIFLLAILTFTVAKKVHENKARYDNYRIYHVEIHTEDQLKLFQDIEANSDQYTFYGHATHVNQNVTIMVTASAVAQISDLLKVYEVRHTILSYNFQEKIDEESQHVMPIYTPGDEFDWDHYFHLQTINDWMRFIAERHQDVTLLDMGTSYEGEHIYGLKLARNPNNPSIFIESGIHAREWIAPATATFIVNQLLTSTDSGIQDLAANYNWLVFPVVNPDGYKYSFVGDRMWRKNRRLFGMCRGVDLNRNFPSHWNEIGASSEPCRYDFAGTAPQSEPETQRIVEFVTNHVDSEKIKFYFALHSYSQLIMFPFGHTKERVTNYEALSALGRRAANAIHEKTGKIYKSGSIYETIYASSGGSKDWAYTDAKIPITFTFELRGMPNSSDLFILPADEIIPTGEEIFAAIASIVKGASQLGF